MNNNNGGLSKLLERGVYGISGIMLAGVIFYALYGNFENSNAVASESEEVFSLDHSRLNPGGTLSFDSDNTTIESILSDSDALCLVAMNTTSRTSISITERASIDADGCAVHFNSGKNSKNSILVESNAELQAPLIYSDGELDESIAQKNSTRFVETETFSDPLGQIEAPKYGECDFRNIPVRVGKSTFKPGVYCGGIIALSDSEIFLEPGVYIMKNGPLVLGGRAALSGENVGVYFTGSNAVLNLGVSSKIALTAPIDGPLRGVLFFEDRNAPRNNEFIIRSGNAQALEGAIYLPKGKFVADAAAQIGQMAKWTALIANKIEMRNSAKLRLNSDYAGSTIPVPEGIWPGTPVASLSN